MKGLFKMGKIFSIILFIISMSGMFLYSNFLMIYRPNYKIPALGLVHPFVGKGHPIYISTSDYLFVGMFLFGIILSIIVINQTHKTR